MGLSMLIGYIFDVDQIDNLKHEWKNFSKNLYYYEKIFKKNLIINIIKSMRIWD